MDARSWTAAYDVRKLWTRARASLRVRNATFGTTRHRAERQFELMMSLIHHALATSQWDTEAFSRLSGLSQHQLRRLQRLACEIA